MSRVSEGSTNEEPTTPLYRQASTGATCRVCFEGDEVRATQGPLFQPCLCNGSVKYIHVKCLERWRLSDTNSQCRYTCPQCKYTYRVGKLRLSTANALNSEAAVPFITAFLTILLLALLSLVSLSLCWLCGWTMSWKTAIFGGVLLLSLVGLFVAWLNDEIAMSDLFHHLENLQFRDVGNGSCGQIIAGIITTVLVSLVFVAFIQGLKSVLAAVYRMVYGSALKTRDVVRSFVLDIRDSEQRGKGPTHSRGCCGWWKE